MPTFLIVRAYFLEQHQVRFVAWLFVARSTEITGWQPVVSVVVHAAFPMMQVARLWSSLSEPALFQVHSRKVILKERISCIFIVK